MLITSKYCIITLSCENVVDVWLKLDCITYVLIDFTGESATELTTRTMVMLRMMSPGFLYVLLIIHNAKPKHIVRADVLVVYSSISC